MIGLAARITLASNLAPTLIFTSDLARSTTTHDHDPQRVKKMRNRSRKRT